MLNDEVCFYQTVMTIQSCADYMQILKCLRNGASRRQSTAKRFTLLALYSSGFTFDCMYRITFCHMRLMPADACVRFDSPARLCNIRLNKIQALIHCLLLSLAFLSVSGAFSVCRSVRCPFFPSNLSVFCFYFVLLRFVYVFVFVLVYFSLPLSLSVSPYSGFILFGCFGLIE